LNDPVFYFVCGLIGLFCVVALGFGPLFFALVGLALAVLAFRQRFRTWWGLPLAAGGAALVTGVALGWGWKSVVLGMVVAIAVVGAAKVAGRLADRRRLAARR
jgi:hypothetical protein